MVLFSLGEFLWSLLVIFFMITYFMMLFWVIVDIFRRKDESGGMKAVWLIALFILPLVGLLIYMLVNGNGIAERNAAQAKAAQQDFDEHVRTVAGGGSADEIAKAKQLLDSGAINQTEYEQIKAKALAAG
jgi:predicted PurR-regulated permease PerM